MKFPDRDTSTRLQLAVVGAAATLPRKEAGAADQIAAGARAPWISAGASNRGNVAVTCFGAVNDRSQSGDLNRQDLPSILDIPWKLFQDRWTSSGEVRATRKTDCAGFLPSVEITGSAWLIRRRGWRMLSARNI